MDAPGIFSADLAGLDGADVLVAIMEGLDADSGTAWECGYAFGKKPIVLVRTDFRTHAGDAALYNSVLTESATVRLDLPFASLAVVSAELLKALGRLEDSR